MVVCRASGSLEDAENADKTQDSSSGDKSLLPSCRMRAVSYGQVHFNGDFPSGLLAGYASSQRRSYIQPR